MLSNAKVNPIGNRRTDFEEILLCPRCGIQPLPLGYPGAISRRDNKTEICSSCGLAEAIRDLSKKAPENPLEDWPVRISFGEY